MKIVLSDISKRYTSNWILKKINYTFESGRIYGVTGHNGSGKSTLMKIISTQLSPTLGKIEFSSEENEIYRTSDLKDRITYAAPYISLLENLSLVELFEFYTTFRKMKNDLSFQDFLELLKYPYKKHQLIKDYSSGMKQRLALAFALFSQSELVLLDEPTSFLDDSAKEWFYQIIQTHRSNSTMIISSNDANDLRFCSDCLHLGG